MILNYSMWLTSQKTKKAYGNALLVWDEKRKSKNQQKGDFMISWLYNDIIAKAI